MKNGREEPRRAATDCGRGGGQGPRVGENAEGQLGPTHCVGRLPSEFYDRRGELTHTDGSDGEERTGCEVNLERRWSGGGQGKEGMWGGGGGRRRHCACEILGETGNSYRSKLKRNLRSLHACGWRGGQWSSERFEMLTHDPPLILFLVSLPLPPSPLTLRCRPVPSTSLHLLSSHHGQADSCTAGREEGGAGEE